MTLIRLFLLTSLFFTFVISSNAQEVSINNKTLPQNSFAKNNVRVALDDYFRKAAELGFSGAVLVAKDGEIIIRKSYGWVSRADEKLVFRQKTAMSLHKKLTCAKRVRLRII